MSAWTENIEGEHRQTNEDSAAVRLSAEQFRQILEQPRTLGSEPSNAGSSIQQPDGDLERVLNQRYKAAEQGQALSLIRHNSFLEWMKSCQSDLILVDANIRASGLERVSATSLLCATLVNFLLGIQLSQERQPNQDTQVVIHFFCGLHLAPQDPCYGPNGLVRSISMLLLTELANLGTLDLDFVKDQDYMEALEEHDLESLCNTLVSLISQFPPETTIFCILDSISCFDKDKTFRDLEFVIAWLQGIVEDRCTIPEE